MNAEVPRNTQSCWKRAFRRNGWRETEQQGEKTERRREKTGTNAGGFYKE